MTMRGLNWARGLLLALLFGVFNGAHAAKDAVFTTDAGAIRGYDPVAYFNNKKAIKGAKAFTARYMDADWYFTSAENRDRFVSMPEKYAPQYGGYCAWAVSKGYTASVDPQAWSIVDGKLYLNYNQGVKRKWSKDIPGNIRAANTNWPSVLE